MGRMVLAPLPHRGNVRLERDCGDCTWHIVGMLQTVMTLEMTVMVRFTEWPTVDIHEG